ncbi:MAG: esterase/lipase family protein [Chthoniobacterales bacterium]
MKTVFSLVVGATCIALFTNCATEPGIHSSAATAASLREARSANVPVETRVTDYLEAASLSLPNIASDSETYNSAAAELTILLRSGDGGRLWNRPLALTANNKTYHLHLQPAEHGVWRPDYFTSFEDTRKMSRRLVDAKNVQPGVGGSLVGVRLMTPREPFAAPKGMIGPVTATLDFHGTDATLALHDPATISTAKIGRISRPLAADFTASIGYFHPSASPLLMGLRGVLGIGDRIDKAGLYFLEPYDRDRIPVVFVHGLASTPFTWMETINALQINPRIREHYQFWVFAYPTGNPILYSALTLREELARADKLYPGHRPYVLVGHSMGGMISRMQAINVTRSAWEADFGDTAKSIFARNSSTSPVERAMIFQANLRIARLVFVCTPHKGSKLAVGGLGRWAISLIRLPFTIAKTITDSITTEELHALTGGDRLPTSVAGLSPNNPALKVVNRIPIKVPFHSIIGDKGRGDSPNSTDGVVPYWSSHVDGAKSECIVPGPHSSCELPQTIAELDRILMLHLKSGGSGPSLRNHDSRRETAAHFRRDTDRLARLGTDGDPKSAGVGK